MNRKFEALRAHCGRDRRQLNALTAVVPYNPELRYQIKDRNCLLSIFSQRTPLIYHSQEFSS